MLTRRELFRRTVWTTGMCSSPWLPWLARTMAARPGSRRHHCILLWMGGGPSQMDTFDMKPGHENGGEFREIATSVPGIRFSEHLPKLSQLAEHLAIVRSLSTKEGDHARGTYLVRTGKSPGSPIAYPAIGASLAKSLAVPNRGLPSFVSILPALALNPDAIAPGFLGPNYAPAIVQQLNPPGSNAPSPEPNTDDANRDSPPPFAELGMRNLAPVPRLAAARVRRRFELWEMLQRGLLAQDGVPSVAVAHDTVYRKAVRLTGSQDAGVFNLSEEPAALREAYGRGAFGQGCLAARRLVERGVSVVEVTLGDQGIAWDTHADNFKSVQRLSAELDAAWSTLIVDLAQRGLLESTTILWIGEFGRTPAINGNGGRDHFPKAWSCVFAGGGIAGGQTFGTTSADGMEVANGPVSIGDVLATFCQAAGVDPETENVSSLNRPIKVAEGQPIMSILL